ncbi:MAG: bifunctional diaminohydroxyphosphoribosylaminopyrimidine deaminase/5-amino-6-(5-phosphoribosylamino)uracil reductase RibD [Tannerellaceae bacterium]|jgi:diaminohydroxyphosphoribosylaminopyrimidine deaminase/5-amino-6-(5-phosphoribosylamino)uracil reductase|nr:bifunctional diaminohydroxyphosphoribosylaminopyrimidine deaminase/5-amino-6-(5-phosphoribosylamino)uracil reductase RibD [Tannerellaceae bacterium]
METEEDRFMARCISLASSGRGKVSPNPMVGAVIVCGGRIIGEGYHRAYGGPHAEVEAIRSVSDRSLLHQSTLYVNLEPCCHQGKTPPCASLIIREGIRRVVIAGLDPYHAVCGGGVAMLREAGVEVVIGVKEGEAGLLNKAFITSHTLGRPYIFLKWAQSADGFIDRLRSGAGTPPAIFSTPLTMQDVHRKRSEMMAIMVGTRTALFDNPSLTVRLWSGKSPVRVVIDRNLSIPAGYNIFDGKAPLIVFTALTRAATPRAEYVTIDFGRDTLRQILAHLYGRNIISLMVEGGSYLINSFIERGLWDNMQIETSPIRLGDGVKAPRTDHIERPLKNISYGRNKIQLY